MQEFKSVLQNELLRRCKKNPGYSLRAFARSLETSHTTLSRVIAGERILSEKKVKELVAKMGFAEGEIELKQKSSLKTLSKSAKYKILTDREASEISDWYHYTILELSDLKQFSSDPSWIAKTIGITVSEAKIAVQKLESFGLLKRNKNGQLVKSGSNTNISGTLDAKAKRSLQREVLEKAIRALDEVPISKRNQTSLTISVDSSKVHEVAELITQFRRSLAALLSDPTADKDSVYNFSFSFYPVAFLKGDGQ